MQEALNNAAKHSRSSRVAVLLEQRDHHAVLIVEDNGVGLLREGMGDGNEVGFGISGMRERAALIGGTFEVESSHEKGTTIFIRVPLDLKKPVSAS